MKPLALFMLLLVSQACQAADIKLPSGIDYFRLKLLERGKPMQVYANMVGIGDKSDAKLLVSRSVGDSIGNHAQIDRRFMGAIQETRRFEVYDDASGGIRDKSDIVVDGMIVAATQDVNDLTAIRKAVTTVRLSIQIKDTSTGKLIKSRTITGVEGDEPGKGTIIANAAALKSEEVQKSLANDFERALTDALRSAAAFLERTMRPVARLQEIENDTVMVLGGLNHGIRENDRLTVFRAKTTRVGETETFGIMKPVAIIECSSVNPDSSQCEIIQTGTQGPPQKGDYAVLSDESLKLHME
jgi:hypothetical protein